MIADLEPYPVMKDSGVPWLGQVPGHWEVRRLKNVLRERDARSATGTEQLLRVSQYTGVTERNRADGLAEPDTRAESLVGYKRAEPGELVVNIMLAWNGSMGVSPFAGIASPAYCVYRFGPGTEPWYFHHLLRSPAYKARIKAVSTGVVESRLRLYTDDLYRLEALFPPLPEQAAIVRFLDHADRRIRRYIRAKQKLIKLLEEQKQAIIHRAVTRGLDPDVRLKPSGVEWLGDVPEHWAVVRLGRLISLTTGFPFKSDGFTQAAEDIRLLRGINISPGQVRWKDVVRWSGIDRGDFAEYELVLGDIVLGMDRPIIQGGVRVAVIENADVPSLLLQRVARIHPRQELRADFAVLLLAGKSFSNYLAPIFTGISVPHLSPEQIKSFQLALPTIEEQERIVEQVALDTSAIQFAVGRAEREISLLREYRTRLIADVVTGKLDVREAAARLPDEADEPEPVDETDAITDTEEAAPGELDAASEEVET